MKITIEREALLKALGHAQSVVERRNTIPILSNVLLKAAGETLALTATDMDIEIAEAVPAQVDEAGETTVPVHMLYDIVRKLPDGCQVGLEGDETHGVKIRSGRSNFRLGSLPVADFPQMSGGDMSHSFVLAAAELRALVDRTKFAISTEETRYYLNGIYLHAATGGDFPALRAAATDGHRLARAEAPLPQAATGMPGIIVPRKTVQEVRKLLEDASGDVTLSLSETKIRFACGDVVLTSKLIDGSFPDYERVIPTANDKQVELDPKVFAAAVDRVAIITSDKSRAIRISLSPGLLVIEATSAENGSASEELDISYDGAPLQIGFNARYLLEIMQQVQGGVCRLSMADASMPTIIEDVADESAVYVLMPMRV